MPGGVYIGASRASNDRQDGPVSPERPRETPLPPELPVESASPSDDESPVGPEPPASPPAVEPDVASGELPAPDPLAPLSPELLPAEPVATGPELPDLAVGMVGTKRRQVAERTKHPPGLPLLTKPRSGVRLSSVKPGQ